MITSSRRSWQQSMSKSPDKCKDAYKQLAGVVGGLADAAKDMDKVVKDWNVPGIGVAVVAKDKVVFAKGYGYRDYGKKLPYTTRTVQPIASNTKLFTATAAGLLVEDGKLDWDKPVREFVPSIQFYNDELNHTISIRDMLSHRTGITRHDTIWYKSDFTRKELFERLKYLEPTQPMRQTFLYNNMMYIGAGYAIELLSGRKWEDFVRERLLTPLGMTSTVFSIADLQKAPEHGVPFTERRDSFELFSIPYYEEGEGVGPAGSMVSNLEDMSRWVIAQLNDGKLDGKQVVPPAVIKATMAPALAMPNAALEARGYGELLNAAYGTGRWTASYRGHLISYHGGDINGFHSQVSVMPQDGLGVVVLVIGDHAAPLYNVVTYNVYERLLGLEQTPWTDRMLAIRLKGKEAGKQARAKAGAGRVEGTKPSHALDDYLGEFEHPAYGVVTIARKDAGLAFDFHKIKLPLAHFHYDRFDALDPAVAYPLAGSFVGHLVRTYGVPRVAAFFRASGYSGVPRAAAFQETFGVSLDEAGVSWAARRGPTVASTRTPPTDRSASAP